MYLCAKQYVMKRTLLLCLAFFGRLLLSPAQPVDLETAEIVASKYMGTADLGLSTTCLTDKGVVALYVFNTASGFVIVAADRCETPIVGYSREGCFDPDDVPVQMAEFLRDFVARIQYGIENHVEADEATARQWESVTSTGRLREQKASHSVTPLLTAKWHQGCLYNSLCPSGPGPCGHFEAGCVAVAMGQIMHHWGYPTTGHGSHSYHISGTTPSADFGNTTYDWEHMPDSLTEGSGETEIEAVATLLYHCGVAVNMFYNASSSTASSASVPDALIRYFSYSRRLHLEKKADYGNDEWLAMLKSSLDLGQPVFYAGYDPEGGHAFVCDGYDADNLLHFNWGWGVGNGYFALGNLNPNGYQFNSSNSAVFDIYPHYEPCLVMATASPSTAGAIEGAGEYHIGESCTLTATAREGCLFYGWRKDGQIISGQESCTFSVDEDTVCIEGLFTCQPVDQITARYSPDANDPTCSSVQLSWSCADTEWVLLKQIGIKGETGGLATDGEFIYVTYPYWIDLPFMFEKYTMDGELVEMFNIDGLPDALSLVYDGYDFYCNSIHSAKDLDVLYRLDFENKRILDTTYLRMLFWLSAYDPEYDGFWLGKDRRTTLYTRQAQIIKRSPTTLYDLWGTGYYVAKDGNPHLLMEAGFGIFDYDINNNYIRPDPLHSFSHYDIYEINSYGGCSAKYYGKDAMYFVVRNRNNGNYSICIYEINGLFSQIMGYRLYRSDSEGNTVMLADGIHGSAYFDHTWAEAIAGNYRFGISELYSNGVESEIKWSNTLLKTDIGVGEDHGVTQAPSVRKVIENNQIVIIKDGKKYNVSGQLLFDRKDF